jgi:hypothetical protein
MRKLLWFSFKYKGRNLKSVSGDLPIRKTLVIEGSVPLYVRAASGTAVQVRVRRIRAAILAESNSVEIASTRWSGDPWAPFADYFSTFGFPQKVSCTGGLRRVSHLDLVRL